MAKVNVNINLGVAMSNLKSDPDNQFSCHFEDPSCFSHIKQMVYAHFNNMNPRFEKDIVYVCIGTDRATGDCLGPMVGTRLQSTSLNPHVFGTLEQPVHAANLIDFTRQIADRYENPLTVAIDASLGNSSRIGFINVKKGGLKPGTALNKDLPEVGDFHISGVVNVGGYLEQMVLQNTRLFLVYRMAEVIARSILVAHLNFENDKHQRVLYANQ
jgi:putative sporulation protein YyaC